MENLFKKKDKKLHLLEKQILIHRYQLVKINNLI